MTVELLRRVAAFIAISAAQKNTLGHAHG